MMPLTYSIAEGILFGVLSYVILKLITGKLKDITVVTAVLAVLFLLKFLM
jgi:AGZA family xanthine/uracil permease-like MFS transporter